MSQTNSSNSSNSSNPCSPCEECGPSLEVKYDPDDKLNQNKNCCTLCTGDKVNNIFYVDGKCKLDEITFVQLYEVLRSVPQARKDLERITSNPVLLNLAREVQLKSVDYEQEKAAADLLNKNTLPYYKNFRGNTDGTIF